MDVSMRQQLEQELAFIEVLLSGEGQKIELQFKRATLLAKLGQVEPAAQAYAEIIKQDPRHEAALNNLAVLLQQNHFYGPARILSEQAVKNNPRNPLVYVNFAKLLMATREFEAARQQYEMALRLDPDNIQAHRGLCLVFQHLGDDEKMQHHRIQGYAAEPLTTLPFVGDRDPIPLLLLTSSLGTGDLPWKTLVDEQVFQITKLVAEFYDPSRPLPRHQLIFNSIADADISRSDLQAAERLLCHAAAPIINAPSAVLSTGRLDNAARLRNLPGVITPRIVVLPREAFEETTSIEARLASHGLKFPLLLRSPGFHMGGHFVYVENVAALPERIAALPRQSLMAIEYLNARGQDGFVRKYRVMMINGQLYPLHLAISKDWKVHYFSAAMRENPQHQTEEAIFLNQMSQVLGEKGMTALVAIQAKLGLDYGGIDFCINDTGQLLVFEANATMNIILPDANPQWDYRRPALDKALFAARQMVLSRVGLA